MSKALVTTVIDDQISKLEREIEAQQIHLKEFKKYRTWIPNDFDLRSFSGITKKSARSYVIRALLLNALSKRERATKARFLKSISIPDSAGRRGVPVKEISSQLNELKKMGLVESDEDGWRISTDGLKYISTGVCEK